ncbi:MAG: amidase [Dietzia sp.]|uniref:amidase n=1 Tax=Dietzia sp. TaxID=1871616 RepID=UPI002725E27B|nr:amidase [Dietzia sp.]MDO8395458.1 amidase [Dietzia sp.]
MTLTPEHPAEHADGDRRATADGTSDPIPATRSVDDALARYAEVEPEIRAFVEIFGSEARADAASVHSGGIAGPLAGVPVAVQDLYDVAGHATLNGSRAADHTPAVSDCTVVRKLRDAGAVIVGKTVTHEYAFGAMSPPTRNPWNLDRVPAGSSGGSGAAVAAGVVPVAMGTDTGGSIRMPAAVCGVVGFKPSYGLISRTGITPCSSTLDHAGPLAANVSLAAAVVDALAGVDPADPGSRSFPAPDAVASLDRGVDGLTLGVPENFFFETADTDIAEAVHAAARELEAAGAQLVPVTFPTPQECSDAVVAIAAAEAALYHRDRFAARRDLFEPDVAAALDLGLGLSAVDLVEALDFRSALMRAGSEMFAGVDAVITPTIGTEPPPLEATSMMLGGREVSTLSGLNAFTVQANLLGAPGLAVPAGLNANGMPVSMHIMTAPGHDALALAIGRAYERRTDWGRLAPPLAAH